MFNLSKVLVRSVLPNEEERFKKLMQEHHYLGGLPKISETMWYVATFDEQWIAILSFSAAALKCSARDRWIGWNFRHQYDRLKLVTNNSRFLILPWVRVKLLSSHLLGQMAKIIAADWKKLYGHPIHYLETFVDKERFAGTCYKAANWIYLGDTTGRGKNDQTHIPNRSVKAVWGYPLCEDFRNRLSGGMQ